MKIWKNPILEGFYPDPSICKVGDRYYLVNSTFAFYPGIPVWSSTDLQNWKQIGNVLDRPSQLQLGECAHSQGIYAPTIRYHDGMYYLVTTNVGGCGNFLVTAEQPEGPWSDPYVLDAEGIDPSLFFDEDGACYYIGTRERTGGGAYFGDNEIWIQRLNLDTKKLEGESMPIWYGFMEHSVWPEGPHLYKKDGWYYLLYAESGTEQHHCIAVARSRQLTGPYEGCPDNPIFTHRHLGKQYPVTCVGHGDLVEDHQGNWYMVLLACRPQEGYTLKGRETFLAKVVWEDGWPVVNPGTGHLEVPGIIQEQGRNGHLENDAEVDMEWMAEQKKSDRNFQWKKDQWPPELLRLRSPGRMMILDGALRMPMVKGTLSERKETSFAAVRQQHDHFYLETELVLPRNMESYECAGLAYLQNEENQVRLEATIMEGQICLRICVLNSKKEPYEKKMSILLSENCLNDNQDSGAYVVLRLRMEVKQLQMLFEVKMKGGWRKVGRYTDIRHLSTELAGGFTGCVAGVYASSNGKNSNHYVDVTQLIYGEIAE